MMTDQITIINDVEIVSIYKSLLEMVDGHNAPSVYGRLLSAAAMSARSIPAYITQNVKKEELIRLLKNENVRAEALDIYDIFLYAASRIQELNEAQTTNPSRFEEIPAIVYLERDERGTFFKIFNNRIGTFDIDPSVTVSSVLRYKTISDTLEVFVILLSDSSVYVYIDDHDNDICDVFLVDDSVVDALKDEYGIEIPIYESRFDDETETVEDDSLDDIVEDQDQELLAELEVIQSNIDKIEDLPEDLQDMPEIHEIYLLLLGKRALIQKTSDEQKTEQIVDAVVNDVISELSDSDVFRNINREDDSKLEVNEGVAVTYNGHSITPVTHNKFGRIQKLVRIDETLHPFTSTNELKAILKKLNVSDGRL